MPLPITQDIERLIEVLNELKDIVEADLPPATVAEIHTIIHAVAVILGKIIPK